MQIPKDSEILAAIGINASLNRKGNIDDGGGGNTCVPVGGQRVPVKQCRPLAYEDDSFIKLG